MMKLFYSTETSSMMCVIAVFELGIECELVEVSFARDIKVKELEELNPLGAVPALITEDGQALTQNLAILEYLSDQDERRSLAGRGRFERADILRWTAFALSDLRPWVVSCLTAEDIEDVRSKAIFRETADERIGDYLAHLDSVLAGKNYVCGEAFTVADCALVNVLPTFEWIGFELSKFPNISRYLEELSHRPSVKKASAMEA